MKEQHVHQCLVNLQYQAVKKKSYAAVIIEITCGY